MTTELQNELLKATPPVGVSITTFCGVSFHDWVYIATIVYMVIQATCLILRTINEIDDDEEQEGDEEK